MPGLIRAVGRTAVIAGTATAVSNGVSRRQSQKWAAKDQQAYDQQMAQQQAAAAAAAPAVEAPAEVDPYAQLKQLAELHDQGILTDEEFAAQKAKILG